MTRCDYVKIGDAGKPVVVIPGLSAKKVTADPGTLESVFSVFKGRYVVYVIDRPDEVPDDCTNEYLADTVASTMAAIGLSDAFVIGVSQGGMIAQYLALKYPALVSALVLGASLCHANDTFREVLSNWMGLVRDERYREFNADMFQKLYSDDFLERYSQLIAEAIQHDIPYDRKSFLKLAEACLGGGPDERSQKLECPVLVLGGGHDDVVTAEASLELASILGCEVYIYPGLRHAIYDEAPDFYKRCMDFFDRCSGTES